MSPVFFIRRPVFAGVISILITLIGLITIPGLPIAQYPELALPTVTVLARYPGASATVVESAVTTLLEQELNGVEGMRSIESTSTNDGSSSITITFEADRDVDIAAVDVQNRVSVASPRLPAEVNEAGVVIRKAQTQQLLSIGFYSDDDRYDPAFLSNYMSVYVVDAIKRVRGVGDVRIYGERRFAMRIWLDPTRLARRGLVAQDVVAALREQNLQVAAGQVGQPPAPEGQSFQISVRAESRLADPDEFAGIIIQRGEDGSLVRLGDVARVELGAESYGQFLRFNGHPGVGLGIQQLPGANALEVRDAVMAELEQLAREFPPGLKYERANDTTPAIEASVKEVLETLFEAITLVVLVIFLFLHGLRSLIIVALTLPVSLIGTFAFVAAFGFSINTLTLFGLTLATGLVVDDAIVVIENIERIVQTEGLSPFEAARKGMGEITSAVIAMTLVLCAVFIPVSFFPGTTGSIYRQFALTIAFSILLSMVCALTLTPALCALLLRRHEKKHGIFRGIDRGLDWLRDAYGRTLGWLLPRPLIGLGAFALFLVATALLFRAVPTGFIPDEDQGFLIVTVQGPEGASIQYTDGILSQVEAVLREQPEITDMFVVGGFSFLGVGPNFGIVFVTLKPWDERTDRDQSVGALVERLRGPFGRIGGAQVMALQPPAIRGVGNIGGFQFMLQDRAGTATLEQLAQTAQQLVAAANQHPQLTGVFSSFDANTPLLQVVADREKAKSLGVDLDQLFLTLQILLGSQYVNDFELANRTYRVYVQADAPFRDEPTDLGAFYVRASTGQMIPLESLATVTATTSPQNVAHFNLYRATELNGRPRAGASTGDALAAMEEVADDVLPAGFSFEWAGASEEQRRAGRQVGLIFALAVLFVFLLLAAQFESFTLPFVVILAVPLAMFGALGFQTMRGLPNDVFCQIALVMLVGLASRNAILIVEFAEQLREQGSDVIEAVIGAGKLRLRPILMTAIAFLFGVVPLVIAEGAGANARRSLGTAVFGGMFVSTFVNLLLTPVLYVAVMKARQRLLGRSGRRVAHA